MIFNMKIEKQLNTNERTLLLGVPDSYIIPEYVKTDNIEYKVFGISHGAKPPFVSL